MDYLIMFGVLCSLFWRSLFCKYVVDDNICYKHMKSLKDRKSLLKKPLYSIWISLYGAGLFKNSQQEYLFTSLLHFLNCCLIYNITSSVMVAILYMVNPVNNQLAVWLNGRRYAVSILLCLLAWNFKWFFLPLYAFAVWLHVYAIAFPVLLLTTKFALWVPISFLLFYLFGWKKIKARHNSRKKDFSKNNELQIVRPQKIIIYIKSLGWYFWHTIFPNKPRMYHEFLYYFGRYDTETKKGYSFNFEFFKGLTVCIFLGYEFYTCQNFWVLWWLVFISQWCNVYGVTQNVSDRYCSLAGIGLMAILNKYIQMAPSPYSYMLYTFFITFYVLRYLPLFRAYMSIDNYHKYHMNVEPSAVESRTLQATRCLKRSDPLSAFALVKEGLLYRPNDFKMLILMSQCLFALKKYEAAHQCLDLALKNVPIGEEEDCEREFAKIKNNPNLQPPKPNRKTRRAMKTNEKN